MKSKVKIGNTTVTPLVYINELAPTRQRIITSIVGLVVAIIYTFVQFRLRETGLTIADFIIIFGLPLISFCLFVNRYKYYICEEGLCFPGRSARFHQWDSISDLVIDSEGKQFQLKTSKGTLKLPARKHFDEAKQLLLQHVPPDSKNPILK